MQMPPDHGDLSQQLGRLGQENVDLRARLAVLEAVFESEADAVYVKDAGGRYTFVNPAGARLLGRTVGELIGQTDFDVFPRANAEALAASDRVVLETGATQTVEETAIVDGAVRIFVTTKSPFRDDAGQPAGIVGIAHDVTEGRLAREDRSPVVARRIGGRWRFARRDVERYVSGEPPYVERKR